MSNSEDTNELEQYGVWVKKTPKDIAPDTENIDANVQSDSFDIDLPDFDISEDLNDFDTSTDSIELDETNNDNLDSENLIINAPTTEQEETSSDDFDLDDTTSSLELDDIDLNIDFPEESDDLILDTESLKVAQDDTEEAELDIEKITPSTNDSTSDDNATEDVSTDDFSITEDSTENISLDEFDISDSSNDSNISTESNNSVDLDDFLGDDFAEFTSSDDSKNEEIIEETPLDINLSFDETANSFETEDVEEDTISEQIQNITEKNSENETFDTESIDLEQFGLDDSEGESISSGLNNSKNEQEIVDYDLKVCADTDDNVTVSMSDIVSGNVSSDTSDEQDSDFTDTNENISNTSVAENNDPEISLKGQEILQQLVGELASLKTEINSLKTDFNNLKSHEQEVAITPDSNEDTGFFTNDDEDDTIALSGDELDNILNTAEFLEEDSVQQDTDSSVEVETKSESEPTETIAEDLVFDDESIFEDEDTINETLENDLEQFSTTENLDDNLPEEIEIPKIEDEENLDTALSSDISNADSEIDNFLNDDESIDSNLTSEKIDYISDDPSISDIDSSDVTIEDTIETEDTTESNDDLTIEPINFETSISDEDLNIDDLDLPEPTIDDIETEMTVDGLEVDSEPIIADIDDEPIFEETSIEEPIIETETESVESPIDAAIAPNADESFDSSDTEIPSDLKQDIKSVLSYMDQLLENLPEEKISEFAQSEHFVTYKKLFQELGLS